MGGDAGGSGLGGRDGGPNFGGTTVDDASFGVCSQGAVGGTRPVQVRTFAGYDCTGSTKAPLVILLHDYASSGDQAEAYFQLAAQADALGFLYIHPDGTKDSSGNEFWNATDACCNSNASTVDDSTYLDDLIAEIRAAYNADTRRVFVFGHGNGGFMAYRLACDHALDVAAVADLGGATWSDASKCALKAPVSTLEIHGTADTVFAYGGGTNLGAAYPSAPGTAAEWVTLDRCYDAGAEDGGTLDLLSDDAGSDTAVSSWPTCPLGSDVALWTIQGGTHQPALSSTFTLTVLSFLLAHEKP